MKKNKQKLGRSKTLTHIQIYDSKPIDSLEYLLQTEHLFTRAIYWDLLLSNGKEQQLFTEMDILSVNRDLTNQRVVRYDVKRTRGTFFDLELQEYFHSFLTFYIKTEKVSYKQGLNELAAPFIIFKQAGIPLNIIYANFTKFVDSIIPNIYSDDDFMTLQCSFLFYNLLLKYHDIELHQYLNNCSLTPELYTTPWFITLFISKCSFKVAQLIYELLILVNDKCFIFYLCVAAMKYHKKELLKYDQAMLPQQLTGIKIQEISKLLEIVELAFQIKASTPASFEVKVKQTLMFVKNYIKEPSYRKQMADKLIELEAQTFLVLTPFELYYHLEHLNQHENKQSKLLLKCPSVLCNKNKDFINNFATSLKENNSFKILLKTLQPIQSQSCIQCTKLSVSPQIQQFMGHNKQATTLFKLFEKSSTFKKAEDQNIIVFFLNFIEQQGISQKRNIVIIDVAQLTNSYIQTLMKQIRNLGSTAQICLVVGPQDINPKPDLIEKYEQFIEMLANSQFNFITMTDEGTEEFFTSIGIYQKLQKQET